MKRLTKYIIPILLVCVLASCKKAYFYSGINQDPSQLKTPTASSLLAGSILSSAYLWGGDASRYASIFTQQTYGNANQAVSYTHYIVTGDDVDNMWYAGTYGGIMTNIDTLIRIAHASGETHYEGVGKILMANMLGLTTDNWGDVPYSEAFKGLNNTQPKYDTQEQVYDSLQALLDDAITLLNATDNSEFQPGTSDDLLYQGDIPSWIRFAHSLKAKFYLHLIKVTGHTSPTPGIQEAGLGFQAGEAAKVTFVGSAAVTTQAPWYQFNSQRGDISFDGHLSDLMTAAADPRADVYFDGEGGLGTLYGNANSSVYFMSYDELMFDLAELQFRAGATPAAATAYNAAVAANLTRSIGDASYAVTVAKTAVTITLQDIITQKYIAEFLNPEVWTDWRRTGYPTLTPADGNVLGAIPRSLLYPSSESRYNAANVPVRNSMLARVWWDVQ